jgi:hypothetical protein
VLVWCAQIMQAELKAEQSALNRAGEGMRRLEYLGRGGTVMVVDRVDDGGDGGW